ncbi:nitroreductase family protein [candidate division KSB1 bacterium]
MLKQKRRDFMISGSLLTATMLADTVFANENQTKTEDKYPPILDSIMKRRSVRHYASTPVPEKHIRMILEAARMAATAGNQQPWKFIITQDKSTIMKLKEACIAYGTNMLKDQNNLTESQLNERIVKSKEYYNKCFSAPVYVTVLTDNESKYPSYNHWDGPLAAANMMIAARALGYGTVHYTDSVSSAVTQQVLNIPDRYERVCFMPIGIPIEWPDAPPKNQYESFIIHNSF